MDIILIFDVGTDDVLLPGSGLEDAFHFSIEVRKREPGKWEDLELFGFGMEGVFSIIVDHFVEFFKKGDGL